ncbi:hypothetical protein PVAR5_4238 [Paecilomyces variotii No. 5]|uniref:Uncharacterized protein n=1 Tax=Byssochlamys spectabilis (strain No. 5 / NBRC 109023) TaxID=1356009 RepID=V5G3Z2_BYSSN|nr:hypothetical protein PVAR5_4238 [Paecilomyces variotii No. 5]
MQRKVIGNTQHWRPQRLGAIVRTLRIDARSTRTVPTRWDYIGEFLELEKASVSIRLYSGMHLHQWNQGQETASLDEGAESFENQTRDRLAKRSGSQGLIYPRYGLAGEAGGPGRRDVLAAADWLPSTTVPALPDTQR